MHGGGRDFGRGGGGYDYGGGRSFGGGRDERYDGGAGRASTPPKGGTGGKGGGGDPKRPEVFSGCSISKEDLLNDPGAACALVNLKVQQHSASFPPETTKLLGQTFGIEVTKTDTQHLYVISEAVKKGQHIPKGTSIHVSELQVWGVQALRIRPFREDEAFTPYSQKSGLRHADTDNLARLLEEVDYRHGTKEEDKKCVTIDDDGLVSFTGVMIGEKTQFVLGTHGVFIFDTQARHKAAHTTVRLVLRREEDVNKFKVVDSKEMKRATWADVSYFQSVVLVLCETALSRCSDIERDRALKSVERAQTAVLDEGMRKIVIDKATTTCRTLLKKYLAEVKKIDLTKKLATGDKSAIKVFLARTMFQLKKWNDMYGNLSMLGAPTPLMREIFLIVDGYDDVAEADQCRKAMQVLDKLTGAIGYESFGDGSDDDDDDDDGDTTAGDATEGQAAADEDVSSIEKEDSDTNEFFGPMAQLSGKEASILVVKRFRVEREEQRLRNDLWRKMEDNYDLRWPLRKFVTSTQLEAATGKTAEWTDDTYNTYVRVVVQVLDIASHERAVESLYSSVVGGDIIVLRTEQLAKQQAQQQQDDQKRAQRQQQQQFHQHQQQQQYQWRQQQQQSQINAFEQRFGQQGGRGNGGGSGRHSFDQGGRGGFGGRGGGYRGGGRVEGARGFVGGQRGGGRVHFSDDRGSYYGPGGRGGNDQQQAQQGGGRGQVQQQTQHRGQQQQQQQPAQQRTQQQQQKPAEAAKKRSLEDMSTGGANAWALEALLDDEGASKGAEIAALGATMGQGPHRFETRTSSSGAKTLTLWNGSGLPPEGGVTALAFTKSLQPCATLWVYKADRSGQVPLNTMIDGGSGSNICTPRAVVELQRIGVKLWEIDVDRVVFGGMAGGVTYPPVRKMVRIILKHTDEDGKYVNVDLEFGVLGADTDPARMVIGNLWSEAAGEKTDKPEQMLSWKIGGVVAKYTYGMRSPTILNPTDATIVRACAFQGVHISVDRVAEVRRTMGWWAEKP